MTTKTEQMIEQARQATKPMDQAPLSRLDQDKLLRCAPDSSRHLAVENEEKLNKNWPPPSLKPVKLKSNLAKWESFDWDRHPKLRPVKRVIVDWYNGLPDSGAIVLAGDVGCGKTHLADAVADLYGRWRISYYGEVELIKKIQDTYGSRTGQSEENIIRSAFRQDLLILDDLGTYSAKDTSWLSNLYNRIFNDYMTVQGKPILITTNLPMFSKGENKGLEARIGARSFSRLCDALGGIKLDRYVDLFGIADFRIERFLG